MSQREERGRIVILGATSGIGRALAAEYAAEGHDLRLAGRDRPELELLASDLAVRYGVEAEVFDLDALAFETHGALAAALLDEGSGRVGGVIGCLGYLGDQETAQTDGAEARRIVDTNYTAYVSLLNPIANTLEERGRGFICIVSSVAGDRGRQSNYVYGSAKAGLTAYLQGLRNRLFPAGVRVVTVKPGFVDTGMTWGMGLSLAAPPESVARGIRKAIEGGKDSVYLPRFWQGIMLVIRMVPERIFKRLRL